MSKAFVPSLVAALIAASELVACSGGGSSLLGTNEPSVPGRSSVSTPPAATPAPLVYVANWGADTVTAYLETDNGNVSPQLTESAGLSEPTGAVPDGLGHLFVTNQNELGTGNNNIQIYSIGTSGGLTPYSVISCGGLGALPFSGAFDSSGNFYVTNNAPEANTISIFPPGSTGCVSGNPIVTGLLGGPVGIAIDSAQNVYVALQNITNPITVYSPHPNGDIAPIRIIGGPTTQITNPTALAFDSGGDLYVANYIFFDVSGGSILEFAPGASGDVAPIRVISGPDTGVDRPYGLTIDSCGTIYESNRFEADSSNLYAQGSIEVFAPGASGDAKPVRIISGSITGLNQPEGISLLNPALCSCSSSSAKQRHK